MSMGTSSRAGASGSTVAGRRAAWTLVLALDPARRDVERPREVPEGVSSASCLGGLPRRPVGPRVGVARVGTRLGQRAGDGDQEEGDEEFHRCILRRCLDKSNRMWFDK